MKIKIRQQLIPAMRPTDKREVPSLPFRSAAEFGPART